MWEKPTGYFEAKPLPNWGVPEAWLDASETRNLAWRDDQEKKKLFGLALAKNNNAFKAGCEVFGGNTSAALWVSLHWLNDPIVLAAKDTIGLQEKLLDKDQLAAKLLEFAEEKYPNQQYACDPKDRLGFLRLYAEVKGFIGKIDIDASTNNFTNNSMTIRLVKSNDNEQPKTINAVPNDQPDFANSPVKIRLVK